MHAVIAQLVEHSIRNRKVVGPIPIDGTILAYTSDFIESDFFIEKRNGHFIFDRHKSKERHRCLSFFVSDELVNESQNGHRSIVTATIVGLKDSGVSTISFLVLRTIDVEELL